MKHHSSSLTRRSFLAGTSAVVGVALVVPLRFDTASAQQAGEPRMPQSFIRIDTNGRVTFLLPTCEMGQGTHTGQAQILAEELGAEWSSIIVDMPKQPAPDYRLPFGQMRSVGSFGIRFWHDPLRRAAAQARGMLTQAAAVRLGADPAALRSENGSIVHAGSGRRIPFGDLVEEAMSLPVPENPTLRPDSERTLTGRTVPRLDTPAKITGRAIYSIDVRRDGMLYGAVRLAPVYSADVESMDENSVSGVVAVVRVPRGAVVVAETWWQAKQAADALDITFTQTPADSLSTAEIDAQLREALDRSDVPVTTLRGDAEATRSTQGRVVEAEFGAAPHPCEHGADLLYRRIDAGANGIVDWNPGARCPPDDAGTRPAGAGRPALHQHHLSRRRVRPEDPRRDRPSGSPGEPRRERSAGQGALGARRRRSAGPVPPDDDVPLPGDSG
ncbi:MAG: molybdopterin-dependent oxidoreductase [Kiloniellaceae bacterium]|nr:molybdopterin-dependent oxidoreductase [Kiloniellaceae bacterium]